MWLWTSFLLWGESSRKCSCMNMVQVYEIMWSINKSTNIYIYIYIFISPRICSDMRGMPNFVGAQRLDPAIGSAIDVLGERWCVHVNIYIYDIFPQDMKICIYIADIFPQDMKKYINTKHDIFSIIYIYMSYRPLYVYIYK